MTSHSLKFDSNDKSLGLTAPCEPHVATVDGWRVSESLLPHPHKYLREKGIGQYKMSIEREVSTDDEASIALEEACQLAKELDAAWCYVSGKPYVATKLQLTQIEAPDYWTGNLKEVKRDIAAESTATFSAAFQVVSRHWTWVSCLPLESVLTVRNACVASSTPLTELMELHVRSHKEPESQLFLLAKSLEIIGAFFAGTPRRATRNSGIQTAMNTIGVDTQMTQSIEWLFNIANERFDVRHAWDDRSSGVALHPKMTSQERKEFVTNADLVIRAFVCDQLGLDVPTLKQGDPGKAGEWNGDVLEFAT